MGTHLLVIALGGTLVLGLYHGYRGGLIRSAFKLLGLLAGILLARPLALNLQPYLVENVDFPGSWQLLVLLSFVAITVVFALVGWLISLVIRWTPLVWVDRIGGAGLGLFMGLLVSGFVLALLEHLGLTGQLVDQATGWEADFLKLLLDITPDLFDELKEIVRPMLPGGSV
jgi:membrane protein required for colicin V production